MLVEFSIIPIGRGSSISSQVARVLKIVDESGIPYKAGPMGTVVEGSWNEVMDLIKKCHDAVRRTGARVVTSITIDDRKGKRNRMEGKIKSVEKRIGRPLNK